MSHGLTRERQPVQLVRRGETSAGHHYAAFGGLATRQGLSRSNIGDPSLRDRRVLLDQASGQKNLDVTTRVVKRSASATCFLPGRARLGLGRKRDTMSCLEARITEVETMRSISKMIVTALIASMMALCSAGPSFAFGTFHGGFGGFHGGFGGFHSGIWRIDRPSARLVGFHPGLHPFFGGRRFVFHHGFFRNGVFINGWWGPAIVTTAWWGGNDGCWTYRPVYDASGNYRGYNYVNICW